MTPYDSVALFVRFMLFYWMASTGSYPVAACGHPLDFIWHVPLLGGQSLRLNLNVRFSRWTKLKIWAVDVKIFLGCQRKLSCCLRERMHLFASVFWTSKSFPWSLLSLKLWVPWNPWKPRRHFGRRTLSVFPISNGFESLDSKGTHRFGRVSKTSSSIAKLDL